VQLPGGASTVHWSKAEQQDEQIPLDTTAPEFFSNGQCSPKSDVFQMGLLVFELFSRREPFDGVAEWQTFCQTETEAEEEAAEEAFVGAVCKGLRPSFPADWPAELTALIVDCWTTAAAARPSAAAVNERLRRLQARAVAEGLPLPSRKEVSERKHINKTYKPRKYLLRKNEALQDALAVQNGAATVADETVAAGVSALKVQCCKCEDWKQQHDQLHQQHGELRQQNAELRRQLQVLTDQLSGLSGTATNTGVSICTAPASTSSSERNAKTSKRRAESNSRGERCKLQQGMKMNAVNKLYV
jgi:hypothetical protein